MSRLLQRVSFNLILIVELGGKWLHDAESAAAAMFTLQIYDYENFEDINLTSL